MQQAQAGDPVFPWPLSSLIQPLDKASLPGTWVAYDHNAVWFIEINPMKESLDAISIHLQSNGFRTHKAAGEANSVAEVFLGTIENSDERVYRVMIYRDPEGLALRISRDPNSFYDLRLYRVDSRKEM